MCGRSDAANGRLEQPDKHGVHRRDVARTHYCREGNLADDNDGAKSNEHDCDHSPEIAARKLPRTDQVDFAFCNRDRRNQEDQTQANVGKSSCAKKRGRPKGLRDKQPQTDTSR